MATTLDPRPDQADSAIALQGIRYLPDVFCHSCQAVIDRLHEILTNNENRAGLFQRELLLHNHYSALLTSAARGCHLCSIFVGTTWLDGGGRASNSSERIRQWCEEFSNSSIKLTVSTTPHDSWPSGMGGWVKSNGPADARLSLDIGFSGGGLIHVVPARQQQLFAAGIPTPMSSFTGDRVTLKLALWWLTTCTKQHLRCRMLGDTSKGLRPARLLYVGSRTPSDLRLYEVPLAGKLPKFMALSYCWGSTTGDSLRLLKRNLHDFRVRIDTCALPRTIQDAVKVTRALGCKYLWVDSLCIIQDSIDDWHAEAKKMGSIYRSSVLTIAALACSTNEQPLFRQRNPLSERPCMISSDEVDSGYVISSVSHFFNRELEVYGLSTAAPLHRRAWVVQERFSATRTLFFGETGVFWECAEFTASEADQQGLHERDEHNQKLLSSRVLMIQDGIRSGAEAQETLHVWSKIREQYTLCELTYESDRLVAILGIMNLIGGRTGWIHYQGMWLDALPVDMCWECFEAGNERPESSAPTWSWGSVRGPVGCILNSNKYIVRPRSTVTADIVAYPAGTPITIQGIPNTFASALQHRPPFALSFMTQLRTTFFLHRGMEMCSMLTLERPGHEQSTASDPSMENNDWVPEFAWLPDIRLQPTQTMGWVMNLVEYEDIQRYAIVGLVLVEVDVARRIYKRVGIMKNKSYRSPEQVAYRKGGELDSTLLQGQEPLPYNELAEDTHIMRLIHLV